MDKAIEIKRRAQRCIQTGDLDGALSEYEKLVQTDDADPYNYVLLADLLFKKNDTAGASERYLHAVEAYEKAGLYKNAIAVCKKMARLSLSPPVVLKRLGALHALDGLGTEASLYYQQYAEHLVREGKHKEAAETLRLAFAACSDSVRVLEKIGDAWELEGNTAEAARAWAEAAEQHRARGAEADAARCASRAEALQPGVFGTLGAGPGTGAGGEDDASRPFHARDEAPPALEPGDVERNGRPALDLDTAEPARVAAPEPLVIERFESSAPGLAFGVPEAAGDPAAAPAAAGTADAHAGLSADLLELLRQAESEFHAGDREAATATLLRAAEEYEGQGRLDSAVAIYRSLSRSASAGEPVLTRWLANAESRAEHAEAAQVACQLGELAVAGGDWGAAGAWFERAVEHDPTNELARRRLQRLRDGEEPVASAAAVGKVSLETRRADAVAPELEGLLAEFQRGVESHIAGDAQSHYDLGMTYREMGLLDQAVESFRHAERDPEFQQRCAELIGRCFLDQGRLEEAIQELESAIALPSFSADTLPSLRFQLGLAYEVAGRPAEALEQLEQVHAAQPGFPEAAHKIRQLKRVLESS